MEQESTHRFCPTCGKENKRNCSVCLNLKCNTDLVIIGSNRHEAMTGPYFGSCIEPLGLAESERETF